MVEILPNLVKCKLLATELHPWSHPVCVLHLVCAINLYPEINRLLSAVTLLIPLVVIEKFDNDLQNKKESKSHTP